MSLEQENDLLRLALKIIAQEKNDCDCRSQKADDFLFPVETPMWRKEGRINAINSQFPAITLVHVLAIDLSPLGMRFKVVPAM